MFNEVFNSFISIVYGKGKNHLIKLCGILTIIDIIFNVLSEIQILNDYRLIENLCSKIVNMIKIIPISLSTVQKAVNINKYFIDQKLTLSGFDCELDTTSLKYKPLNYTAISKSKEKKNKKTADEDDVIKYKKQILLCPSEKAFSSDMVTAKKIPNKAKFEEICGLLSQSKLGKIVQLKKNTSQKPSCAFLKTNHNLLSKEEKDLFLNELCLIGINIDEYYDNYNQGTSSNSMKRVSSTYSGDFSQQSNPSSKFKENLTNDSKVSDESKYDNEPKNDDVDDSKDEEDE